VAFCLSDFVGHGVGAALNTFRLHTMLERPVQAERTDPALLLASLNSELHSLMAEWNYATLIYGVIDLRADRVIYASASAPNPIIGEGGGAAPRLLDGSGLPLGLVGQTAYENRGAAFPPGGFLFLYSDALSDSGQGSRPIGDQGVLRLVTESVAKRPSASSPVNDILQAFARISPPPHGDDLTALWIERMG
jgi:sigma-B regulation protein RsbU (phosphoserine phosphatase)